MTSPTATTSGSRLGLGLFQPILFVLHFTTSLSDLALGKHLTLQLNHFSGTCGAALISHTLKEPDLVRRALFSKNYSFPRSYVKDAPELWLRRLYPRNPENRETVQWVIVRQRERIRTWIAPQGSRCSIETQEDRAR